MTISIPQPAMPGHFVRRGRTMPSREEPAAVNVWLAIALAVASLPATIASAAEVLDTFVLRDWLDRRLQAQLVSRPIAVPAGAATVDDLVLTGPAGPVPVQAGDIEFWPDGRSIKTARVFFVTDLGRLETKSFSLSADASRAGTATTGSDLRVVPGDDSVELTTRRFGARFPLGRKTYADPADPVAVPPPVLALRLPDGTWFGGGAWFGRKRIVEYEARLTGRGPVFGEVRLRYVYEDGVALHLVARLAAGDSLLDWTMDVTPHDREAAVKHVLEPGAEENPLQPKDESLQDGWRLILDTGLDQLRFGIRPEFGTNRWGTHRWLGDRWSDEPVEVTAAEEPAGLLVNIVPWNDWWDGTTKTELTFSTAARGPLLAVRTVDPAAWVEAAPRGTWAPWGNRRMRQKWLPLVRGEDRSVFLQIPLASGRRRFLLGGAGPSLGRELDRLQDCVLDWPERPRDHPRLYMTADELQAVQRRRSDAAEIRRLVTAAGKPQDEPDDGDNAAVGAWLLTGDRRVAEAVGMGERLRRHLELFGDFDRMRSTFQLCGLYDAALSGDLLKPAERRVRRAQMAYLAYRVADAETWSMERGYCSGNLNMSVTHVLNKGLLGCALGAHPRAREWQDDGLGMLDDMLARRVGPAGEWPESVANYASVSISALVPLAIAARSAGRDDVVDDERMERLTSWLAKQYTPPDPRPAEDGTVNVSRLPPVGRGGAGGRNGLPGLMARATAASDPAFSAMQQWVWMRCGRPRLIPDRRLGGWEHVYLDDTLPAVNPGWTFDLFPRTGAILRHGIGTPHEWYAYLLGRPEDEFPSECGGLPLVFAKGAPIVARFSGGYAEREELFVSRVLPARPRGDNEFRMNHFYHEGTADLAAAADLPGAAYVRGDYEIGTPRFISHENTAHDRMMPLPEWPAVEKTADGPVHWRRQVLLLRDRDPAGPNTLFVRDGVSGGQPTMWQMWFLSETIGTPAQARTPARLLAAAPGKRSAPARPLAGDRFTVLGQFGIDTEVFVASPGDTPRHTLRWGRSYDYSPLAGCEEYMDLLHLQRADDGAYVVALHPRQRHEPVPEFTSLADGHVVRVSGAHGSDYGFLSDDVVDARADDLRFKGTAATVSIRRSAMRISLAAKGGVQFRFQQGPDADGDYELAATGPVGLQISNAEAVIDLPPGHGGTAVRLRSPDDWKLSVPVNGLQIIAEENGFRLHADAGVQQAVLQRGR
jgi:hypothetical protein